MKYCLIQFLLLKILFASAQVTTRKVIDRQTNAPVVFATIKILGKPSGVIASDKGEFELNIEPTDSVLVSCVGYEQTILSGKYITSVIYLDRRIKTLSEITISEKKFIRTLILGNGVEFLDKKIICDFQDTSSDCWPWGSSGNNKEEFAEKIRLPDSIHSYKIKKIYLPRVRRKCVGPLLLHIYLEDTSSGFPGEELFLKPLYLDKSNVNKNKVVIDLNDENIYLYGAKSFFISFGWLPDAGKENCLATIILIRSAYDNTYSRTLSNADYHWYRFGKILLTNNETAERNTIYAVELDEMK
jgi:hypothetical protein